MSLATGRHAGRPPGISRRKIRYRHRAPNTKTRENLRKIRKMDLDSGSSGGEWKNDVPLAILRELQGMGDEFDHSMGESESSDGSDGGSDGCDPRNLPTILHEGERRWVRVPQRTTTPTAIT